jgi:hypothetical protein
MTFMMKEVILQMIKMSMKDLADRHPEIVQINELVGEYEIIIRRIDRKLKVKVFRYGLVESPWYIGIANLEVKEKGAIGCHRNYHNEKTEEDALKTVVDGFLNSLSDGATIRRVEDW